MVAADHVLRDLAGVEHHLEVGVPVIDNREEHVVAVDPGIVATRYRLRHDHLQSTRFAVIQRNQIS